MLGGKSLSVSYLDSVVPELGKPSSGPPRKENEFDEDDGLDLLRRNVLPEPLPEEPERGGIVEGVRADRYQEVFGRIQEPAEVERHDEG